jgi:uracil-DNA glycosylase
MEQIPPIIHESWHPFLQELFDDEKMLMLKDDILPRAKFYPQSKNIFRVFSMPFDQIKVVILGQDPYPQEGQANGLAFAVNPTSGMPKSLQIIKNEVFQNMGISTEGAAMDYATKHPDWRTLKHWHNQGVFLLNTALTVGANDAGSHLNYWNWFTREVIHKISNNNKCVWLLWGGKAHGFMDYINKKILLNKEDKIPSNIGNFNVVLKTYHPAAEAYDPTRKEKFTGCNHFHLTNKILDQMGKKMIDW